MQGRGTVGEVARKGRAFVQDNYHNYAADKKQMHGPHALNMASDCAGILHLEQPQTKEAQRQRLRICVEI